VHQVGNYYIVNIVSSPW